jgi:hypothetical protein
MSVEKSLLQRFYLPVLVKPVRICMRKQGHDLTLRSNHIR